MQKCKEDSGKAIKIAKISSCALALGVQAEPPGIKEWLAAAFSRARGDGCCVVIICVMSLSTIYLLASLLWG